jgi:uncharacterized membrane protein YgcG
MPSLDAIAAPPGLPHAGADQLALLPDTKETSTPPAFPDLTGWVIDYAGLFTEGEKRNFEATLSTLARDTSHQVVLVTASSIGGRDPAEYAGELARLWRFAVPGTYDGAIIFLAPREGAVVVEVGDDLKDVLTPQVTDAIIFNTLIASPQAGDSVAGVRQTVKFIALALNREARGFPVTSLAPLIQRRADAALRACPQDIVGSYDQSPVPKVLVGSAFGCRWSSKTVPVEAMTAQALRLCESDWGLPCTVIESSAEMPVDVFGSPPMVSIVECANPANPGVAIDACTAVLGLEEETEETYAEALSNRGLAHYYKGDPQSAVADWDEALRRSPMLMVAFQDDPRHIQATDSLKSIEAAGGPTPPVAPVLHYRERLEVAAADLNHRNYARAFNEIKRLALLGYAPAQFTLGKMYVDGNGLPADPIEGNWWLYLSAENGYGPGRVAFANNLSTGNGVPRDPEAAAMWLRRAAGKGYAEVANQAKSATDRLDPNFIPPAPVKTVTVPRLTMVGSNLNEDDLRAAMNDPVAHREDIARLTAKSILIPEIVIEVKTVGVDGAPIVAQATYRNIELHDIAKGVVRSSTIGGLNVSYQGVADVDLGSITLDSLDLSALLAIYFPPASKSPAPTKTVYKRFKFEGGVWHIATTRCEVRGVTGGGFRMRPPRQSLADFESLSRRAYNPRISNNVLFGIVRMQADYLDSWELDPLTWDGLDCTTLDSAGKLFSYGIGKTTVGAVISGRFLPVMFENLRFAWPGTQGRITLKKLVVKGLDLSRAIAVLRNASDADSAEQWLPQHVRQLIPEFAGFELSGMRAERRDEHAPAQWETTTLARAGIDIKKYVDGLPTDISLSISNFTMNNLAGNLTEMGVDASALSEAWDREFDLSAQVSQKRNPAQNTLKVVASVNGVDLGAVDVAAEFAGITDALIFGDPAARDDVRLKSAQLNLDDRGLVLLGLSIAAKQAGKDVSAIRNVAASWAEGTILFSLDASPAVRKLATSVSAFIGSGKSLSVNVKAKDSEGIALDAIKPLFEGSPTKLSTELDIRAGTN